MKCVAGRWCRCLIAVACLTGAKTVEAGHPHAAAPVPPTMEIEVLDPGVDPRGNPAILVETDENGGKQVNIPPTVLVHRYYYTGDRSFQGPMIPGGPSIIVVHHPRTGERLYVDAQMLPGAPRVTYHHSSIEYEFGENAVMLEFPLLGCPKVKYRNGRPLGSRVAAVTACAASECHDLWRRTGIPDRTHAVCECSKTSVKSAATSVNTATTMILTPVKQVVQFLPFGTALTSSHAQRAAEKERDRQVMNAARSSFNREFDIRTVR
jgi:hypothetical protein